MGALQNVQTVVYRGCSIMSTRIHTSNTWLWSKDTKPTVVAIVITDICGKILKQINTRRAVLEAIEELSSISQSSVWLRGLPRGKQ